MIRKNLAFYIPFLIWMLIGGLALLLWDKAEIHMYLNRFHNAPADVFFYWITNLGDGIFAVVLLIILLFISFGKTFLAGISVLISTIVTQLMKRLVYSEEMRPSTFFKDLGDFTLRVVPDLHLHGYNSFPSGHANTAFCLFLCLTFFTNNHWLKFLWFTIAFLTAYSRVYLSQHFLVDIYFGSLLAVLLTMVVFHYYHPERISRRSWFNKSLIGRDETQP